QELLPPVGVAREARLLRVAEIRHPADVERSSPEPVVAERVERLRIERLRIEEARRRAAARLAPVGDPVLGALPRRVAARGVQHAAGGGRARGGRGRGEERSQRCGGAGGPAGPPHRWNLAPEGWFEPW